MNSKVGRLCARPAARLLLRLFVVTLPAAVQAQINYVTNNSSITIIGGCTDGEAAIPSTINGLPVTTINGYAFYGCTNLTSVSIPNSVTSIGNLAFFGCTRLASVTIPNSVTAIGGSAFAGCTGLTSVSIPNSVTYIREWAFDGCTGLNSVTIPNSVTNIEYSAFSGCTGLTSVSIPNSVTTIGSFAFFRCIGLASVTIPNSVTAIGDCAFLGCTGLNSVTIPNSVTAIGGAAFSRCTGLKTIEVGALNRAYSSLDGVLFDKNRTTLIKCPEGKVGSYAVPNSVTRVWNYAFTRCTRLTSVYFQGDSPSFDGESMFEGADQVTVYYLPGTTGWGATFAGRPTAVWVLPYPVILSSGPGFGAAANGFGFIVSWATNAAVVVEASPALAAPVWTPVSTNTLTAGTSQFADPQWTDYPSRLYRLVTE